LSVARQVRGFLIEESSALFYRGIRHATAVRGPDRHGLRAGIECELVVFPIGNSLNEPQVCAADDSICSLRGNASRIGGEFDRVVGRGWTDDAERSSPTVVPDELARRDAARSIGQ